MLDNLSQEKIQGWVGTISIGRSAKSVKNAHGLLTSAISMFCPEVTFGPMRKDKICALESTDIPRFHNFRHYSASIMHAVGIPDVYIMQRGGWTTDNVFKTVYRHTLNDKEQEMNKKANTYFSKLCNTK